MALPVGSLGSSDRLLDLGSSGLCGVRSVGTGCEWRGRQRETASVDETPALNMCFRGSKGPMHVASLVVFTACAPSPHLGTLGEKWPVWEYAPIPSLLPCGCQRAATEPIDCPAGPGPSSPLTVGRPTAPSSRPTAQ